MLTLQRKNVASYADEALQSGFSVNRDDKLSIDENLWTNGYSDRYLSRSPVGAFPRGDMASTTWEATCGSLAKIG